MKSSKRDPWWKRRKSLSAGESTLLGLAIGMAAAVAASLNPPHEFSLRFLSQLLVGIGLFGATGGYGAWLFQQPDMFEKVRKIAGCLGLIFIGVMSLRVPGFWREIRGAIGASMIMTFIGFIFAMSFFIVCAWFGILQLINYFVRAELPPDKPTKLSSSGNLWDGELDFG